MENTMLGKYEWKEAGVSILKSDKVDFIIEIFQSYELPNEETFNLLEDIFILNLNTSSELQKI